MDEGGGVLLMVAVIICGFLLAGMIGAFDDDVSPAYVKTNYNSYGAGEVVGYEVKLRLCNRQDPVLRKFDNYDFAQSFADSLNAD